MINNTKDLFYWENNTYIEEVEDFKQKVVEYWDKKSKTQKEDVGLRKEIIKKSIKIEKIFDLLGEWHIQKRPYLILNSHLLKSPNYIPKIDIDYIKHAPDLIEEGAAKTFLDRFSEISGLLEDNVEAVKLNHIKPWIWIKRYFFFPFFRLIFLPLDLIQDLWFLSSWAFKLLIFIGGLYGGFQGLEWVYNSIFTP